MSEVVEKALFSSVPQALDWAYKMEHVSHYPTFDPRGHKLRFNNWTDLSTLEKCAQAAYLVDIVETRLKAPETAVVRARHASGFTQLKGVHSIAEYVRGIAKNTDECLTVIVAAMYIKRVVGGTKETQRKNEILRSEYSKRKIASRYSVNIRSIEDDWMLIKGHVSTLERMAYSTLDVEFKKYDGLIEYNLM